MSMDIEGLPYEGDYTADGVEPQATAETPQPGFVIYYDVDNYTMVKDGDVTYIRPYQKPMTREEVLEAYGDYFSQLPEEERERQIDALMNPQPDTSLPTCEIEIVHLDMPYEDAASQERAGAGNAVGNSGTHGNQPNHALHVQRQRMEFSFRSAGLCI